jgi:hypothetical protein
MNRNFLYIIFSALTLLTSCHKEVENPSVPYTSIDHGGFDPSEQKAIIEVDEPLDGSIIDYDSTLKIAGTMYANFTMHGYQISIFDHGEVIWQKNKHIHGNNFNFEYSWKNELETESALTIKILVVGNHFGTLDFTKELMVFAHGKS